MISRVETLLDTIDETALTSFKPEDCNLLREFLACPMGSPTKYHVHQVTSLTLEPEHLTWLQVDLDEWVVVEHTPEEGFNFWFTSEQDAVSFERSFS